MIVFVVVVDAPEAVVVFALAAIPGVIVLEIVEYGRPRWGERTATRDLARYLLLSLVAWVVAIGLFAADDRIARAIELDSGQARELVDAYIALAWRLGAAAALSGLVLRGVAAVVRRIGDYVVGEVREGKRDELGRLARPLAIVASPTLAWDSLLVRLRRSVKTQIVHVRLRDGGDVYGVFAAGGRADWQADGRDLLLDAELTESDEGLTQVEGSSGVFIPTDAIASVSFVEYSGLRRGGK
jgi:hypothetical protein